jgi:hypothetical protein
LWEGQNPQIEVEEVVKVILFVCGMRNIEGLHRGSGSKLFQPLSRGGPMVGDVADLAAFHQYNAGFDNRMET